MRDKIIAFILIFTVAFAVIFTIETYGQTIGDTDSPYSTNGWDLPIDSTQYYKLPIYRLLSNPGGWINWSQRGVDSLLNALIVYTDSLQLYIKDDTLRFADEFAGSDTFTVALSRDTVLLSGADSLDVFLITAREDSSVAIFTVQAKTDTIIVIRSNISISGQKYNWVWIRRYQ